MPQSAIGTTRREIRQRLGFALGDMILLEAESGTTTTLVDSNHIHPASYRGRFVYFYSGANNGKMRRIVNAEPPQIEWDTPLASAIVAGVKAELWNMNGVGFRPDIVSEHIRNAHRKAIESDLLPLVDTSLTYSSTDNTISVPTDFRAITGVQFDLGNGQWYSIPRAARVSGPGYWVNRYTREIEINGQPRYYASGNTIRLLGYGRENELTDDSATTITNAEWLIAEAGRSLIMATLTSDADTRFTQQKLAEFSRESELKRSMVRSRRAPTVDYLD